MCRLLELVHLSAEIVCVRSAQTECCCLGRTQMLEGSLLCLLGVANTVLNKSPKAVPATH